jgi:hypothetical protein
MRLKIVLGRRKDERSNTSLICSGWTCPRSTVEKPDVLRRSAHIKELERKAKVKPQKEQAKLGKSTR